MNGRRFRRIVSCFLFFFNDTATTEIYTLSIHDALPIYAAPVTIHVISYYCPFPDFAFPDYGESDRKSTRLNSSHLVLSHAVFCLQKKRLGPQPDFHAELPRPPAPANSQGGTA